jgi:hypothetical protein
MFLFDSSCAGGIDGSCGVEGLRGMEGPGVEGSRAMEGPGLGGPRGIEGPGVEGPCGMDRPIGVNGGSGEEGGSGGVTSSLSVRYMNVV